MTDINTGLTNIIEQIIPEEEANYFSQEEELEVYQTCIYLMEEFIETHPTLITEPDFDETFDESIQQLMHSHFEGDIFYNDNAEEEMDEIIEHAKSDFFKYYIPLRSHPNTHILKEPDTEFIEKRICSLTNRYQPVQRTKEWYEFRHKLITASNAYKAFENPKVQNQLIYEKCQPLKQSLYIDNENDVSSDEDVNKEVTIKEVTMVNVNTTLHWGQKYEPLSVKIYEHLYDTRIGDFGCIQHEKHLFLGASPDGINIDKNSSRYGRMLEIKNIVNREITGIPKKEYWIQTQLQMEVCDLDECDFLETRFIEYPDYSSYLYDTSNEVYEDEDGVEFQNVCLSNDGKMKGQFIYFHTKEGKPFYEYKPLDVIHPYDIENWYEKTMNHYQNNPEFNYVFMKCIYWKLEEISCVLIERNRLWFKSNISTLAELWKTVEKERVSGYSHRAPNRKQKKDSMTIDLNGAKPVGGCLLQFNKDTGKITVVKNMGIAPLIG